MPSPTGMERILAGRHGPAGLLVSQWVGRCTTIGTGGVTVRLRRIVADTGILVTARITMLMAASRRGDLTGGLAAPDTSIIRTVRGPGSVEARRVTTRGPAINGRRPMDAP